MLRPDYFYRVNQTVKSDPKKQVESVDVSVIADDIAVTNAENQDASILVTDLQLQSDKQLTGWVPNTNEMMKSLKYVSNEWVNVPSNNKQPDIKPQTYNMNERIFNIVGRGHSTITVPNYFPENWDEEVLPSGVDFTIYPKENFKIARISSAVGVLLPEGEIRKGVPWRRYNQFAIDDVENRKFWETHPLHYRYTREFWIEGGHAYMPIQIHASRRSFKVNGVEKSTAGVKSIFIPDSDEPNEGWDFPINRMRHLLAPRGSIRFRIEFYNHVSNYGGNIGEVKTLQDTGVGFFGTASFKQWKHGNTRI